MLKAVPPLLVLLLAVGLLAACDSKPPQPPAKTSAVIVTDPNAPLGQLPGDVEPLRYMLSLTVRPDQTRYSGAVKIDVALKTAHRAIYLHGKQLDVTSVQAELPNGLLVSGKYEQVHETGVVRLTFDEEIPVGRSTLRIEFDAPFNDKPDALTRQFDGTEAYVWTQFESISARRAFPCFDEPRFKVPFDIAVTARAVDQIVSNAPVRTEVVRDGSKRVTFATTAPLPTYLVALAVGPYDVVTAADIPKSKMRAAPLPLRGFTVKGKGERMRFALEQTPAIVDYMENYFGTAFPYPKLDLIAPPNFSAGGMENAGAITYSERLILLDDKAPLQQKRSFYLVHAHELAHQWFGDLVTPKWWNDIWLNESFATWMGNKTATALFPKGEYDRESARDAMLVMDEDALPSARSIRQEIKTTGDIYNAFDGLTYDKGGGVLSMFESYLGPDKFRDGVREHMKRFANSVADVEDFMQSLAQGSRKPEIVPAFESFLNQPGVPLVRLTAACEKNRTTVDVTQSPYGQTTPVDTRQWRMPVCLRELSSRNASCVMMEESAAELALVTRCSGAWMPNAGGAGYYRFALAPDAWKTLLAGLDRLTPAEQIATLHSLRAASRAGDIDGAVYADVLERLVKSPVWDVMELSAKFLTELRANLLNEAALPSFQAKMRTLLADRMAKIGLKPRLAEPASNTLLRAHLAEFLVKQAKDPVTTATLAGEGMELIANAGREVKSSLPAELRAAALWAAVNTGGRQAAHDLMAAIKGSGDSEFRTNAAIALTAARDKDAIAEIEQFYASGALRVREQRYYMRALFDDPERRDGGWAWLRKDFDKIAASISKEYRGRFVEYGEKLCSAEQAASLKSFFEPLAAEIPGADRKLANALDAIDRCVAWRNTAGAQITAAYRPPSN